MYRYLAVLLLATSVWAQFQTAQQYPPAGYPQYQPPDNQRQEEIATDQQHGVARISVSQGDVNVKRGDNGQLTGAILNAPLMSQDRLETSPGSRAEVQFDGANVIRLAPNTDLGLANLAYQRYQVQLGMGTLIVRVLSDSQAQFEIDTPSVAFHPTSQGEYRISVFDNGTSQISVRSGRVEMSGPRGSQVVNQGQSLLVRGDAADPEFQEAYEAPRDQFDDWSASRDGELMSGRSYQYVSPDINGAADLDRYGNWVPSQYGQVWAPQGEPADWSPYSDGQWSYGDYYGWTWVGHEPWGWAPYHYGRWFWNTGQGWCWWPGARGTHYWSPALVSFFGFGGGLGWVSLAPYEVFHPWWGRGFRSFDSFHAYDLGRYYRNAAIRGGAMTAGFGAFAGAGHRYAMATRGQLGAADLYRGRIPVSPSAGSYRFSDRAVMSNARLSQAGSRPFFSRQQQFSAPRAAPGSTSGWQHFGSPGNTVPQQRQSFTSRPYSNNENGWHSFGQPQSPAPRYNYSAPAARYNYHQQAPHYNYSAPSAPHYSAPAAPHYSAPAGRSAPSYHGNDGGHSGGGGFGGGGHSGGGHSSSGGGGGRHR